MHANNPLPQRKRRRFLFVAAGALSGVALRPLGSFGKESSPFRVNRRVRALGTEVSITALHEEPNVAEKAIASAFSELERVESLMSLYREDSQIRRLNRQGRMTGAHPYLLEVLRFAQELSARSEGAFDVTVQPLWELYRGASADGRLPDSEALSRTLSRIGWRRLRVDSSEVEMEPGTAITLNGIAQGYAADRAIGALVAQGVMQAFIDTGELGVLGEEARGKPWKVGIQHPRAVDAYISLAELKGRCLATSGDYETTFTPDFRQHHLIHPRNGRSPQHYASVSVAAPTAMAADALSTAVFMLPPEQALALLASYEKVDALLVHKDGRVQVTENFPLAT